NPKGTLALCDGDEDTLTLAWEAATAALNSSGIGASQVSGLWWGTTRPPFAEGPSLAFLSAGLGLESSSQGALLCGSTHSGMEALLGAWDAISSGGAEYALVVASDALVPGLGTTTELTTGAGAGALLLGSGEKGACGRLLARSTRSAPVVDRYRADAERATGDAYDPRLFREEIYLPLLSAAGTAAVGSDGAGAAPEAWAVSDPDGKLAGTLVKRMGARLVSGPVQASLGDTGAAAPILGLVQACAAQSGQPGRVGMIGYGGGRATAVVAELDGAVPGSSSVERALDSGTPVTYTAALRARGQLDPMAEPIQMGLPPGGAAFARGNTEMLLLEGARCESCGTISTPPSVHPACTGCGGTELETVKLSRRGTVVTFVVNQTMPPPFAAPLPLMVIDLDDGARLMVQGTPADAELLAVGDTVGLTLRRYALERGIPVYGYKASRITSADGAGGESAKDLEEVRR
ncbi:MAG: OB-fold domain-containing protein, partial [Acidimicrobiales bacterium]